MTPPSQSPAELDSLLEALAAEPDARRRRQLLAAHRRPEVVSHLYDEVVRLARIDLRKAERMAHCATWLSSRVADEPARALGLRAAGHIHYLRHRTEPAWRRYEAALEIYERLGMEVEVGRTLSGALHTLIFLGRYDEAFTRAQRAREIFERHGDRLRLARLDVNIANVLHRQDRFEEALELYQRAHAALGAAGDHENAAIALRNMATCQISINDFRGAMETYTKARVWCVENAKPLLVGEVDYNIAYLYYLRGEYTRAIELYAATRERCRELGDAYHQGLCDLDQSEMYLELNLSEEAERLARLALEAFRTLRMGYEAAKALTNLAIAASRRGNAAGALELFSKARALFTKEENLAWTATIDLYQALVYFQETRLEEARRLCIRALEYFAASPFIGKASLCQCLLARVHLSAQRSLEAREACELAIQSADRAESPALSHQAYFVLGMIEEALGEPERAYQAYLNAHAKLEDLRSHLHAEEVKIAFLKDKLAVYESLVRMCLNRPGAPPDLEAAFAYIEQAKSRSLADLIAFRAHQIPAPRETRRVLVEQVGTLREQLNWYGGAIRLLEGRPSGASAIHIEKLRRAARECERRLVESISTLRAEEPEYADLQAAGSIDLETIRGALAPDACLVQFYRVRDVFHACLLTRRGLKIAPLGRAAELRRSLQLLRFQLSKFRLGPEYARTFHNQLREATTEHLREFYRQLIAPIEKHLDAAHLIIAPHDFLHYLPFQALLDGDCALGERYSISYTPSGSVYYLCRAKAAPSTGGALVMGIPDPIAPQILDEVDAVAAALPGAEVLIGSQATHQALREKGAHSRFIHIATHGWFRQDNPMFSSISLGDSQLNLFDLYQLNLPAELVTLSGCGTGLNVVVGGDELLGLKRGLLYAGAQGVLLTLWDVNDQSTAEFMKLFYERLRNSTNKAEALQYATAEIRRAYEHPFYWAPFVLVGKYD
jgi:tetratricopeptide (TPR) repeat protein